MQDLASVFLVVCALGGMLLPLRADARDAARDLRRLSVPPADAATVAGLDIPCWEKYLRLITASPLRWTSSYWTRFHHRRHHITKRCRRAVEEYKVPDAYLYSFKLLIDNEVGCATSHPLTGLRRGYTRLHPPVRACFRHRGRWAGAAREPPSSGKLSPRSGIPGRRSAVRAGLAQACAGVKVRWWAFHPPPG
jgi:hypothetical protein